MYRTITGRELDTANLSSDERKFLAAVQQQYRRRPSWTEFASWWTSQFDKTALPVDSVVYRLCHDLEARLGIAEGKVAPPDYRDYLADLIEERYGSRYKFCRDTGVDPGHLSRVLASRSDLSLASLHKILRALDAVLVIQPQESLDANLSPEEVSRALAGGVSPIGGKAVRR
jgi:transcriptional regulator with XRE-family HTH domain